MDIIDRVNILMEKLNISSDTDLSNKIGVGQRSVSYYLSRERKPSLDFIEKIVNSLGLSADWLLTGKGNMEQNNTPVLFDEKIRGAIPYYADLPVSAGEQGLSQIETEEKPTGYMLIPNVSAERIFPVVGCSMLPKIKPGDVIGTNTVNTWDKVEPDKIYMIVTNEERMIKRLRTDPENNDILWCVSDNYKEFKIDKNEIKSIFHVVWHGELM